MVAILQMIFPFYEVYWHLWHTACFAADPPYTGVLCSLHPSRERDPYRSRPARRGAPGTRVCHGLPHGAVRRRHHAAERDPGCLRGREPRQGQARRQDCAPPFTKLALTPLCPAATLTGAPLLGDARPWHRALPSQYLAVNYMTLLYTGIQTFIFQAAASGRFTQPLSKARVRELRETGYSFDQMRELTHHDWSYLSGDCNIDNRGSLTYQIFSCRPCDKTDPSSCRGALSRHSAGVQGRRGGAPARADLTRRVGQGSASGRRTSASRPRRRWRSSLTLCSLVSLSCSSRGFSAPTGGVRGRRRGSCDQGAPVTPPAPPSLCHKQSTGSSITRLSWSSCRCWRRRRTWTKIRR